MGKKYVGSKASVLVVEDTPEIQRYFEMVLQLDGYHVSIVSSGEEALQQLQTGSDPDIVLLDVQMPGMGGVETLRFLRALRPQLQVIMCSGVENPETVDETLSLGAKGYLVKPIRHLYLSAAIEQCLAAESSRTGETVSARVLAYPSPIVQSN